MIATFRETVEESGRKTICFLPTQCWDSGAFQRPQQMARALVEAGVRVIYCEEWRHDTAVALRRRDSRYGIRVIERELYAFRAPVEQVIESLRHSPPDYLLFYWPNQAYMIPTGTKTRVAYEVIDDHSLFTNLSQEWQNTHDKWLAAADVVVATADDLLTQLQSVRADTQLIPNGVRVQDWENPPLSVPVDLVEPRKKDVVVGYYGALAEWFDWDLWGAAARAKPEWSFVLVGYPYDGDEQRVHRWVSKYPNMSYLGRKPYRSLPAYLRHWDVATIPFVLNAVTHACSPVKLFEYMAAGKPIVTTAMREVVKYRSLHIAEDAVDFVKKLERAVAAGRSEAHSRLLRQEAGENSWLSRARQLLAALEADRVASATSSSMVRN